MLSWLYFMFWFSQLLHKFAFNYDSSQIVILFLFCMLELNRMLNVEDPENLCMILYITIAQVGIGQCLALTGNRTHDCRSPALPRRYQAHRQLGRLST